MNLLRIIFNAAVLGLLLNTGCVDSRDESTAENPQWREQREQARRAINERLDAVDRDLERLGQSIEKAGSKVKQESKDAFAKLKQEAREARARTGRYGETAEDRGQDMKKDLEAAADKLESRIKQAWEDLKN
jgi:hypothetical protein